jgi:hypothetical protein
MFWHFKLRNELIPSRKISGSHGGVYEVPVLVNHERNIFFFYFSFCQSVSRANTVNKNLLKRKVLSVNVSRDFLLQPS